MPVGKNEAEKSSSAASRKCLLQRTTAMDPDTTAEVEYTLKTVGYNTNSRKDASITVAEAPDGLMKNGTEKTI